MSETHSETIVLKKEIILKALKRFRDISEVSDDISINYDTMLAKNAMRNLNDLCEMFKDL